jgi:Cu/Ag efflux protein CusF
MIRLPQFCIGALALVLLMGLATPVLAEETSGTVRTVNGETSEIVLKGVLKDTTYKMNKDAWVTIDGRKAKLADLKEGDRARISFENKPGALMASWAQCLRNAQQTNGTVKHVIADKNELVLKGVLKDSTYHMEKNPAIYINNKESNFSDLREADLVHVTYLTQDGRMMVTEIRAVRK